MTNEGRAVGSLPFRGDSLLNFSDCAPSFYWRLVAKLRNTSSHALINHIPAAIENTTLSGWAYPLKRRDDVFSPKLTFFPPAYLQREPPTVIADGSFLFAQ